MEKTYNRIYGEYLGYPDCCIKAFGDVAIFFTSRPMNVQLANKCGFVPCSKHANMLLNGEITYDKLINTSKRKCSVPFKEEFSNVERMQIMIELDKL